MWPGSSPYFMDISLLDQLKIMLAKAPAFRIDLREHWRLHPSTRLIPVAKHCLKHGQTDSKTTWVFSLKNEPRLLNDLPPNLPQDPRNSAAAYCRPDG